MRNAPRRASKWSLRDETVHWRWVKLGNLHHQSTCHKCCSELFCTTGMQEMSDCSMRCNAMNFGSGRLMPSREWSWEKDIYAFHNSTIGVANPMYSVCVLALDSRHQCWKIVLQRRSKIYNGMKAPLKTIR